MNNFFFLIIVKFSTDVLKIDYFCAQISRKWAHHVTTVLFFGFGFWTLWEGIKGDGYISAMFFNATLKFVNCTISVS